MPNESRANAAKPVIVGIDFSLSCTGLAGRDWTDRIKSAGKKDDSLSQRAIRLLELARKIVHHTTGATLVVVEQPAYSQHQGSTHDRSGLWWLVVGELRTRGIAVAEVAPNTLKKYLTGRGNADKDEVLSEVIKRFPGYEISNNNEADALGLAAMGYDWAGQPLVPMPESQRKSLQVVRWPEQK